MRITLVNRSTKVLSYVQGQSPGKFREYFYYIDHQGFLFLDDSKMKNFTSCLKDKPFLTFFFSRLRRNDTGSYQDTFPWVSPCGREKNYIRCDDTPFVFTRLLEKTPGEFLLCYANGGDDLSVKFEPEKLCMLLESGRLYHPAPERVGGAGLVKSSLSIELSNRFKYESDETTHSAPLAFEWNGRVYQLTNVLRDMLVQDTWRLTKTS
jgi:hypothetical protein